MTEMFITESADCISNGNWQTVSPGPTYALTTTNSTETIYIKFRNAAGEESQCYSDTILHDNIAPTPPSVLIVGPTPNSLSHAPALTFVDGTDAGSGISRHQVQISGVTGIVASTWSDITSGTSLSGLALTAGQYYVFQLRAVDNAGNFSAIRQSNAFIASFNDVIATINISGGYGQIVNVSPITLEIKTNASTNTLTVADFSLQNATISTFSGSDSNYYIELLPQPGASSVTINMFLPALSFQDLWGNLNLTNASFSFTYEPTAVIALLQNVPVGNSSVTDLNIDVLSTGGIIGYRYKIGNSNTDCSANTGYTPDPFIAEAQNIADVVPSTLTDDLIHLCVLGVDGQGRWQTAAQATKAIWRKTLMAIQPAFLALGFLDSFQFQIINGSGPYTYFMSTTNSPDNSISSTGLFTSSATTGLIVVKATDANSVVSQATVTIREQLWTWISGADTINQNGNWGTLGVTANTNVPSARYGAFASVEADGKLLIFGGRGHDSNNAANQVLDDLWRFDGTNWTWIKGTGLPGQSPVYGQRGVASPSNTPGSRYQGCNARNPLTGRFWIFGGRTSGSDFRNDLWEFNGSDWIWQAGGNTSNELGDYYGTKGVAASGNKPGARYTQACWFDDQGNFWLFGGSPESGDINFYADLWQYDGSNWTWVSGSKSINSLPNYGSLGVASPSNHHGARRSLVGWFNKGNHYLFGGTGPDSAGNNGRFNDLWVFDGTNWTWIRGANFTKEVANYGTKYVAANTNTPGARHQISGDTDVFGNFYLLGGNGYGATSSTGPLSDLWKFNGTDWIWMGGSTLRDTPGVYGTKGTADYSNLIGASRYNNVLCSPLDNSLWIFGGDQDSASYNLTNSLWRWSKYNN
jgi:hypothetical protein